MVAQQNENNVKSVGESEERSWNSCDKFNLSFSPKYYNVCIGFEDIIIMCTIFQPTSNNNLTLLENHECPMSQCLRWKRHDVIILNLWKWNFSQLSGRPFSPSHLSHLHLSQHLSTIDWWSESPLSGIETEKLILGSVLTVVLGLLMLFIRL